MFRLQQDPNQLPPLVLAYLGDAVYELFIRSYLVSQGQDRVNDLHRAATEMVRAASQAKVWHVLEGYLNPNELRVMKRGRNAKSGHVPRHAEVIEYRLSTGLESLLGYLYVKGDHDRLQEVLTRVLEFFTMEEEDNNSGPNS